ncbi:hypothetical protein A6U96_16240 [Agrobacterium tumefaciens]|nr:hypothetical protein A6U94_28005 [Agrobacterium tumefaciens]OCJ59422.1 hypothetical protein A6U96_16240 [Agrobacterium tumefaciens]
MSVVLEEDFTDKSIDLAQQARPYMTTRFPQKDSLSILSFVQPCQGTTPWPGRELMQSGEL